MEGRRILARGHDKPYDRMECDPNEGNVFREFVVKLKGSVALVTGSSSGIGAASARALAAQGCRVAVTWNSNERGGSSTVRACRKAGAPAELFRLDVTDDEACRRVVREVVDKWRRLDILVNSAGVTRFCAATDLEGLSAEDFLEIYRVNVVGVFQTVRAAAPFLKARPVAHVVNVSSMAALNGRGSSIAYAASKGALLTMGKSLARVLGPRVRVNTISPGLVSGAWAKEALGEKKFAAMQRLASLRSTLKGVPKPEEIASVILGMVQGGDMITGSNVPVDGGAHLGTAHLLDLGKG